MVSNMNGGGELRKREMIGVVGKISERSEVPFYQNLLKVPKID